MAKNKQKLIIDADVIIHFHKGGKILELGKIFPKYDLILLDIVQNELSKKWEFKPVVDNLVNFRIAQSLAITNDLNVFKEFARLKKTFGDGESACMAYCRYNQNVLASSNLKDIKAYCITHNITYFTTMDFLLEAYNTGLFNEATCDEFIYNVKSKGSKLPVNTIEEFIKLKR